MNDAYMSKREALSPETFRDAHKNFDDWLNMFTSFEDPTAFVVINYNIWLRLRGIFGGGPEIMLHIVDGKPDLTPITIKVFSVEMQSEPKGMIVSKKMTVKEFKSQICQ